MWTANGVVWPHRPWERAAAGIARDEEVQAWPPADSRSPNEPVECQLVGSRETKGPGLASFVKALPLRLFVPGCLGREIAVTGRRGQTPHPKGHFMRQRRPPMADSGGDLWRGAPRSAPIICPRPAVRVLEWPGVLEQEQLILNSLLVPLPVYTQGNPQSIDVERWLVWWLNIRRFRCPGLVVSYYRVTFSLLVINAGLCVKFCALYLTERLWVVYIPCQENMFSWTASIKWDVSLEHIEHCSMV